MELIVLFFCFSVNTCAVRCLNGGKCGGNICICLPGFTGPYCGQRKSFNSHT